ncbi:MAG: hypothetical protein EOM46_09980 [Gammaproteobacteria bacterium]|nr:hypothetical protein [Gammaproteobacteria bacterium]
MKSKFNQSGIALLEVLIAFTIVMVAVVAIYQLQNKFIKSEYETSAYLSGLQLAESKLDDLRTFSELSSTASAAEDGYPSYEGVGNDTGGHKLSAGGHTVGIFNFDLHWTSEEDSNSKDIVVTVSGVNSTANITLFGSVSRIQKVQEDKLASISGIENETPQVNYKPGDAPDVISISLGEQLKQETTKPFPKVEKENGSGVEVNFQNITYNDKSNTQVLVDTSTVSCDCTFASSNTPKYTTNPAQPLLVSNLLYWATQREEKSKWGVYVDSALKPDAYSDSATQKQTSICDACCENHFKGSGSALQDYYNPINYTDTSKYNSSGSVVSSGEYIDSCRVMRLDGYYSRLLTEGKYNDADVLIGWTNFHYGQLLPDWNLVKLNIMSYDFLSQSQNQAYYVSYVKYVVKRYIDLQKLVNGKSSDLKNLSSTSIQDNSNKDYYIQSFQEWLDDNVVGEITLDVDSSELLNNQLVARGIFVDILPLSWLNTLAYEVEMSDDLLSKISFADVNMTLLVRWSPSSKKDSDVAYVSNDDIDNMTQTIYDGDELSYYKKAYKRGELSILSGSGDQVITAKAYRGNSSIAGYLVNGKEIGVTPYDNNTEITSTLTVRNGDVVGDTVKVLGRLYCYYKPISTVIPCTDEILTTIDDQPVITGLNGTDAASISCALKNDIPTSGYRQLECTAPTSSSFTLSFNMDYSLTVSSSPYRISYPETLPITISSTLTTSDSDETCINIYNSQQITKNSEINQLEKCLYP